MHLQIKLDIGTKIKHIQQALTNKDYNVKVQACDGAVETRALHITSKWVRDMAQDRGCCRHEPVLFLPDTDKKTVALLDRILMFGSAEITLHEGGNIQKIFERVRDLAKDLGLKLFHIDVVPVAKKELEDKNNNKVIEVLTIEDDEENEDCEDIISSPDKPNEDDEGEESYVSSNESSLISHSPQLSNDQVIEDLLSFENEDNLVSVSSDGATSSLEDKTSDINTNLSTDRIVNEVPVSLSGALALLGEKRMTPRFGSVTPDNRSRRDSIITNIGTPNVVMEPVDEFMTKCGDSTPEKGRQKKPLTTTNCNFDLNCEFCGKALKTDHAMQLHTASHHMKDLEKKVSCHMTEDNRCKICGDSFKTKNTLITHLGTKHGYVNDVLVDNGFAVLPCPLNSPGYSASMQRKLVKLKTERKDALVEEAERLDGQGDINK